MRSEGEEGVKKGQKIAFILNVWPLTELKCIFGDLLTLVKSSDYKAAPDTLRDDHSVCMQFLRASNVTIASKVGHFSLKSLWPTLELLFRGKIKTMSKVAKNWYALHRKIELEWSLRKISPKKYRTAP